MTPHTFFIPVMGTGYTIDTPLRVAPYGISSVISTVDDVLIEQMRRHHCEQSGRPYEEIDNASDDARASRITAYIDLLDELIAERVAGIKAEPFEAGSDITRYFQLLAPGSVRDLYASLEGLTDADERARAEQKLRDAVCPGRIEVNIMAAMDAVPSRTAPDEYSDALSALRGFAASRPSAAVVFSAGINPRLYRYAATLDAFRPSDGKPARKEIILKVSDFRSALVQARMLARMGLWVSEFRVESGLNAGGHVFPFHGRLLGPVLSEFLERRDEMREIVGKLYRKAAAAAGFDPEPPAIRFTAQGGIGTAEEDAFLREHYRLDGTGWASAFLLAPDVACIAPETVARLLKADENDIYLSLYASPLGIPFWNLRTSESETTRRSRIRADRAGSPCPKRYAQLNTDVTKTPICRASRAYARLRLKEIRESDMSPAQRQEEFERVLGCSCICHDLAGGATRPAGIDPNATPAVCPGPSSRFYTRAANLDETVDHIYGRAALPQKPGRPHMFLYELALYVEYLRDELKRKADGVSPHRPGMLDDMAANLSEGVGYYRELLESVSLGDEQFTARLAELEADLTALQD